MNKRFVLGIDRSNMRLFDVDMNAQDDLVDSGQDEAIFDKTNFGNKTDKFSAIKDFKI